MCKTRTCLLHVKRRVSSETRLFCSDLRNRPVSFAKTPRFSTFRWHSSHSLSMSRVCSGPSSSTAKLGQHLVVSVTKDQHKLPHLRMDFLVNALADLDGV